MQTYQWVVDTDTASDNQRIDQHIAQHLTVARHQVQHWLAAGYVTYNDAPAKKNLRVQASGRILITLPTQDESSERSVNIPVLYEDEAVLVINKPAGLLMHPVVGRQSWTVADWLAERLGRTPDDTARQGIVHRLDQPVTGTVVLAKTLAAERHLKQQFHNRAVKKIYHAVVHGVPAKPNDVITFDLDWSQSQHGKVAARPSTEGGRSAETRYETIATYQQRYAYLAVQLITGRTHQIRAHLAAINHPIVGDHRYVTRAYRAAKQPEHLLLHAHQLGFTHPVTEQWVEFTAPLPDYFAEFINTIFHV